MTSARDTAMQKLEAKMLQRMLGSPTRKHLNKMRGVIAAVYAAIAPRILLRCLRVGLPNIHCSIFASNFCMAVSHSDVMVKVFLCL